MQFINSWYHWCADYNNFPTFESCNKSHGCISSINKIVHNCSFIGNCKTGTNWVVEAVCTCQVYTMQCRCHYSAPHVRKLDYRCTSGLYRRKICKTSIWRNIRLGFRQKITVVWTNKTPCVNILICKENDYIWFAWWKSATFGVHFYFFLLMKK